LEYFFRSAASLLCAVLAVLLAGTQGEQREPVAPAPAAPAAPAPPVAEVEAPAPEAAVEPARLRVESSLRAQVRLNGRPVGRTPLEVSVEPGPLRVEVHGSGRRGRFDKAQQLELRAGEQRLVSFDIQEVYVPLLGPSEEMRVASVDGRPMRRQRSTTLYEGWHRLGLIHVSTGRRHTYRCEVRPWDGLCR
jgi:eukaryotic-like serine/threonine-protein kinase